MKTSPFNESKLWKGKIQLSNYPRPIPKPDMYLSPITYHNGQLVIDGKEYTNLKNKFSHPDGLPKSYASYSKKYWEGVNERKLIYRNFK